MRVVAEGKRTIRLLNLREACSKDDILGVMAWKASISQRNITLSDVSSTTRQRTALIQFPRFADFKLALRMLEICNRADTSVGKLSQRIKGSKGQGQISNSALGLLWCPQEITEAMSETTDNYIFLQQKLKPLTKLKVPEVLADTQ